MPQRKVVELRAMDGDLKLQTYARFVLGDDGTVQVVGVTPNGRNTALSLIRDGIRGPGRVLTLADGPVFLKYLEQAFRGDRLWCTEVLELDLPDP